MGDYQVRFESRGTCPRRSDQRREAQVGRASGGAGREAAKSSITVSGTVVTARTLKFQAGSTVIAAGGSTVIAELADQLLRNPGSGRLRVQSDGEEGLALSRALVIKQGLADLGVPESQVEAVGEPAKAVTLSLVP